jgi:hypothetical protein
MTTQRQNSTHNWRVIERNWGQITVFANINRNRDLTMVYESVKAGAPIKIEQVS